MARPALCMTVLITACAGSEPMVPPTPDAVRARVDVERRIAVAQPGTLVCRDIRVGIGTVDWVRGSVVRIEGDNLIVKILDAGRFGHSIGGVRVEQGVSLRDALTEWATCQ